MHRCLNGVFILVVLAWATLGLPSTKSSSAKSIGGDEEITSSPITLDVAVRHKNGTDLTPLIYVHHHHHHASTRPKHEAGLAHGKSYTVLHNVHANSLLVPPLPSGSQPEPYKDKFAAAPHFEQELPRVRPLVKRGFSRPIDQCDHPLMNMQFLSSMCFGGTSPRAYTIVCVTSPRDQVSFLHGSCYAHETCIEVKSSNSRHKAYCVRNDKLLQLNPKQEQSTRARVFEINESKIRTIAKRGVSRPIDRCNPPQANAKLYKSLCVDRISAKAYVMVWAVPPHEKIVFLEGSCLENERCVDGVGSRQIAYCVSNDDIAYLTSDRNRRKLNGNDSRSVTKRAVSRPMNRCDHPHLNAKFFFSLCLPHHSAQAYKIICNNAAVVNGNCHENEICVESSVRPRAYCVGKDNIVSLVLSGKHYAPQGSAQHAVKRQETVQNDTVFSPFIKSNNWRWTSQAEAPPMLQNNSPGADFLSSGTSRTHLQGTETREMKVAGRDSYDNCEDHGACADKYAEGALNRSGCLASCVRKESKWLFSKDYLAEPEQEQNQQSSPERLMKRQRDDTPSDPHLIEGSRRISHPCSPPYVGLKMWFSFCVSRREYSTFCAEQDSDQVKGLGRIDGYCNANEICMTSSHRSPAGLAYCVRHRNLPKRAIKIGVLGGGSLDYDDGGHRLKKQYTNADASYQSGSEKPVLKTYTRRQPDTTNILRRIPHGRQIIHQCDPPFAGMRMSSSYCRHGSTRASTRAYRIICYTPDPGSSSTLRTLEGQCNTDEICTDGPVNRSLRNYVKIAYCVPSSMRVYGGGNEPAGKLLRSGKVVHVITKRTMQNRGVPSKCNPPFIHMDRFGSYCEDTVSPRAYYVLCLRLGPMGWGIIRGLCTDNEICVDSPEHSFVRTARCVPHAHYVNLIMKGERPHGGTGISHSGNSNVEHPRK